jgi:phage major head subunit gpT-like protein
MSQLKNVQNTKCAKPQNFLTTKHPKYKTSQIKNIPATKQPKPQNVPTTKHPKY